MEDDDDLYEGDVDLGEEGLDDTSWYYDSYSIALAVTKMNIVEKTQQQPTSSPFLR